MYITYHPCFLETLGIEVHNYAPSHSKYSTNRQYCSIFRDLVYLLSSTSRNRFSTVVKYFDKSRHLVNVNDKYFSFHSDILLNHVFSVSRQTDSVVNFLFRFLKQVNLLTVMFLFFFCNKMLKLCHIHQDCSITVSTL